MAKERSLTPEKQLLNLIEDPKSKTMASLDARGIRQLGLSFFSSGAWSGRISFLKEAVLRWSCGIKCRPCLDIKLTNKVLGFSIFPLAFYFVSSVFASMVAIKNIPYKEWKAREGKDLAGVPEPSFLKKAASHYLEKARGRDIFKMGEKQPVVAEAPSGDVSSRIVDATQHLKLVGISWSSDPDAMIEDSKALKTFFVKRGQMIGEVKVEAIFKDKVVLSYEGEETELQ